MPSKAILTPTQELYQKIFGELPKRDIIEADMPALYEVLDTLTDRDKRVIEMCFGLG
ncbi:hypothetical protein FWC63_01345 [Candidatus Saccharibacteria bacterium]|nr:hypothetical protein [Candidatus Saccharibacteria bacterium]